MKIDPVIQAVRDVRHKISESVDHDPKKMVEYYQQLQKKYSNRIVSRTNKDSTPQDEDAA